MKGLSALSRLGRRMVRKQAGAVLIVSLVLLLVPPLLLSFILTFLLFAAMESLHFHAYAFRGRTLPGCRTGIRPRGPPVS